ncbi:MAG: LuxR C-terminal-related transcriptional regulator [Clostridia bacterium]|nr:LuxR C-terminal-related transcriptional regulator [Clostridia bacterium]
MFDSVQRAFSQRKGDRFGRGTSLQRRLIALFISLILFVILSFIALLMAFNITGSGSAALYNYLATETNNITESVSTDFGRLSVQGVSLSETLASQADNYFRDCDISAQELRERPELIHGLLERQIHALMLYMDNNMCGGAFIILDASVTGDHEFSQAGIYLTKTQANPIQSITAKSYIIRGPAQIARENGIELLGQWRMEYPEEDVRLFEKVLSVAREHPDLPLSRLYYLTEKVTLAGHSESAFMLCIPLRSADGCVFGLCGVEISARMFKQLYSPHESDYIQVFTAMTPCVDGTLMCDVGMVAGNMHLTGSRLNAALTVGEADGGFTVFSDGALRYGGLHKDLTLYPSGSPYADEHWSIAVMMPINALEKELTGLTPYLVVIASILLLVSLGASIWISRKYLSPLNEALTQIKSGKYTENVNSPYFEINDLMEYLARQDEQARATAVAGSASVTPMFEAFLKNMETLSPAERSVFDLYIEGCSAQEIADRLYLSINTIKTHNRRIFAKLNVSSRRELLVYIGMMKEMKLISDDGAAK